MSEMAGVELIDLTEMVESISIPCDYDRIFRCGPKAAGWVVLFRCGCGAAGHRLICDGCKSVVLAMEDGLRCPNECGEVFIPARKAIAYMEPLDQRPM